MPGSLKRRDFIKSVSLAGASIAMAGTASPSIIPSAAGHEIKNKFFTVSFDIKSGSFSITRSNGTVLLSHGTTVVHTTAGMSSTAGRDFRHAVKSVPFSDRLGTGRKLIITSRSSAKQTDLEIHLSLYDHRQAITVEAICKNVSSEPFALRSITPVHTGPDEGGLMHIPDVSKCITNGQMYFDDGMIHSFGSKESSISSGKLKGVKLANEPFPGPAETIHSWWNVGFFSGYDKPGVAIGYLENKVCLGNLLISRPVADQISFVAESVYAPELRLDPGESISSNRIMINVADNPYLALEDYAEAVGKLNAARTRSIVNGWCSWFYTLAQVSQDEVVSNTKYAAKHLKPYGLEYIQIDEGFQQWHGDWEGNERFPNGMKWLADEIKSYGFKAGIWISPYVVSEPSELFRQHQDWLVKNADGTLQRVGNWPDGTEPPDDENPKRYCLDITHPGAAQWLHDLIHTIVHTWGYEMIKIDFVAWSILAAKKYHDPTLSSVMVYRKGMAIMREAAGDKCHILECGPGATTVGLIDSMRIELDVNYGYSGAAWNTYFLDPACSASAAGKRYYFHQKTWVNDVDHLCTHLLNNQQSEAAATIIAMSGGNVVSGDRLTQLDPYKLDILRKITPSYGQTSVPIDLFDADIQTAFAMKITKAFGTWTVAAFFNPDLTAPVKKSFSLKRLWLDAKKVYLAYDFWNQQFIGEITDQVDVTIQPGSVRLLALHEKSAHPKLIATDRHILQGALEIEDIQWNEGEKVISGISLGPGGTSHNVYIYVPGDHDWTWGGYVLFRDYEFYTLKLVHQNIIQVHVRFEQNDRVSWQIDVERFFK